jgi:hypothetical protein
MNETRNFENLVAEISLPLTTFKITKAWTNNVLVQAVTLMPPFF